MKGFSQRFAFKLTIYTLWIIIIGSILRNFQGMIFTIDPANTIYYLILQLVLIPLFIIILRWVFKFREKYFSIEPSKRKSKYFKQIWLIEIIGFILFIFSGSGVFGFAEDIESVFGPYSFVIFICELTIFPALLIFIFGAMMNVVIRARPD